MFDSSHLSFSFQINTLKEFHFYTHVKIFTLTTCNMFVLIECFFLILFFFLFETFFFTLTTTLLFTFFDLHHIEFFSNICLYQSLALNHSLQLFFIVDFKWNLSELQADWNLTFQSTSFWKLFEKSFKKQHNIFFHQHIHFFYSLTHNFSTLHCSLLYILSHTFHTSVIISTCHYWDDLQKLWERTAAET